MKNKILIVDDSELNRVLLSDMLSPLYDIEEATNGKEAITYLSKHYSEISLVLLDIVMPEMDGFEVLRIMKNSGWIERMPVIIISAETSAQFIDQAYDLGAAEYINRPFEEKTILRRVNNTIILYSKQKKLEDMVAQQVLEKEKSTLLMVDVLSHIVEFRNGESGLHVVHIRVMTEILLKHLIKMSDKYKLSYHDIKLIATASAMHDIGKISIPESILNKPGKLTFEEFELMKKHALIGSQMLEKSPYYKNEELLQMAADICHYHHERYDGKGYPEGLKGDDIPISAQVVSIADVYDALTSKRVYKPAYSHEQAIEMIFNGECGTFNPLLLQCLKEVAPLLKDELQNKANSYDAQMDLPLLNYDIDTSSHTLSRLQQERTKYQFFSSLTKDIEFEYDYEGQVLIVSDKGAEILGITPVLLNPLTNKELLNNISRADFIKLQQKINKATKEDPVVQEKIKMKVAGKDVQYLAILRPVWFNDESKERTKLIGKMVEL